MSPSIPPLITAALLLGFAAPAIPAQQEISPTEAESMLSTLETFKEKNKEGMKTYRGRVIREISAASASNAAAMDFYFEAVKATDFAGKNRENTEFRDWKKKNEEKVKSREMQNAVRLQLAYLALTLQKSAGAKTEDLIGPLLQYTGLVLADPAVQEHPEMKKSLEQSLVVRWYNIGGWLQVEGWELSPGNVDGIFETTILPEFRKAKDPRLIQYWDAKIEREGRQAAKSSLDFNAEKFTAHRRPALLWNRAQDTLFLGEKSRAIAEMLALIKAHPAHPEAGSWIASLEGILKAAAAPALLKAAAAPTPAAPASAAGAAPETEPTPPLEPAATPAGPEPAAS